MKKNSIKLAPSILNADFTHLEEQIKTVEQAGVDWIHLDIMDGHFVPNITFGPPIVDKIKKVTELPLDAHLMIENPDQYLQDFKNAGADHVTIHIETGYHVHRTIEKIHDLNMKAGITLNPATPVQAIEQILPFVDLVLVMTVNPGFGGQQFIPEMLTKIKKVATSIKQIKGDILLEVDGGLSEENILEVVRSGAEVLVIGSAIYGSTNIVDAVKRFRNLLNHL